MSPSQLHDVFHVNELDLVPHYELVKLSHLTSQQHVRKKRSIESASKSTSSSDNSKLSSGSSINSLVSSNNHHVKKDLSKSSPYSEKSFTTFANGKINKEQVNLPTQPPPQQIKVNSSDEVSDVKITEIKEHKVTFDAFGEKLNLTLRPTKGLFRNGPQTLKMWHAHPDPSATDGINYEEIKTVSPTFTAQSQSLIIIILLIKFIIT